MAGPGFVCGAARLVGLAGLAGLFTAGCGKGQITKGPVPSYIGPSITLPKGVTTTSSPPTTAGFTARDADPVAAARTLLAAWEANNRAAAAIAADAGAIDAIFAKPYAPPLPTAPSCRDQPATATATTCTAKWGGKTIHFEVRRDPSGIWTVSAVSF